MRKQKKFKCYDFKQEKFFNYKGLDAQQVIEHISRFIADLWQIHIFGEGNTRTTAVFLIKYLRKLGFTDINNDLFAEHSWYFRNALVRANYKNLKSKMSRLNEPPHDKPRGYLNRAALAAKVPHLIKPDLRIRA